MDYYFDSAFSKYPLGPDKTDPKGKKEIGKIILPAIKRLQNKIEQSHWIKKLSEKLGVTQEAVLQELKSVKTESNHYNIVENVKIVENKDGVSERIGGRKKLLEDKIVSLVLKDPQNLSLIEPSQYCFFGDKTRELIEKIRAIAMQKGNDAEAIFADLPKDEYKDLLDTLAFKAEVDYEEDGQTEIKLCISALKDIELRNELGNLLRAVESESNEQKREELIKEFNQKAKELHQKS